jgi:RNA polymerase sporulation-specific sigma factor
MCQFPEYIQKKLSFSKTYYSLDSMDNIEMCKVDPEYLGDVMLVNENLIWHSIHKYIGKPEKVVRNMCVEKEDLIQLGRIGFLKAIRAFDTRRGIRFSSFAVIAIVREVKCFLRDSASIIRPTRTASELMTRIHRIERELQSLPPVADLAMMLDSDVESVTKAMVIGKKVVYLDEPHRNQGQSKGPDCEVTMLDLIMDQQVLEHDVVDKVYAETVVEWLRGRLKEEEIRVLQWRMCGFNQAQAAEKERMSQMRVSRIMKKISNLLHDHEVVLAR